jgi:beta-lactamase class A
MQKDRRKFLTRAGLSAAGAVLCRPQASLSRTAISTQAAGRDGSALQEEILELFSDLPDRKAFKIWAPGTVSGAEVLVELNANRRMFVASTMKSVILCERLRQLDSPTVERQIAEHELVLDKSVWSPGSTIFNPPDLSGLVSEQTAMEAMIVHSDNTATDMVLKEAGADAVRKFIFSIGLKKTMIPDSTRVLAAYLAGAPNYKTITWDELMDQTARCSRRCWPGSLYRPAN